MSTAGQMYRGAVVQWTTLRSRSTDRAGRRDLIPKSRLYVHLSSDVETAKKVGSRHGRPVIYEMLAIRSEIDAWKEKKASEEANARYNEILYYGLTEDIDEY